MRLGIAKSENSVFVCLCARLSLSLTSNSGFRAEKRNGMNLTKNLLLLAMSLVATLFPLSRPVAQNAADQTMAALLNDGDLFRLEDGYTRLKDSLSYDLLRLLAEAQLGVGFNRLEQAAVAMDSLLLCHQDALGPEGSLNLASLRAMNLLNLGLYAAAGQAGADLVAALNDNLPLESMFGLVFIERVGRSLADVPPPTVSRPAHTVSVPLRKDSVGRGQHLYIPVEVNGVTRDFIFDTGCSFGHFVSERYARDAGLRILADSIPVAGMNLGFVKLATADSMRVGEITLRHPVFLVASHDPSVDSLFSYDGVLDNRFLCEVGEVTLDNENGRCLFPAPSDSSDWDVLRLPNMYFSSNQPYVRIAYRGESLDLHFDTGNVKSDLGPAFARRFPEAVAGLDAHATQRGGFGGVVEQRSVTLPTFEFTLSELPVRLIHTEVLLGDPTSAIPDVSGSLGADFVLSFKRLTIDYRNMSVSGDL